MNSLLTFDLLLVLLVVAVLIVTVSCAVLERPRCRYYQNNRNWPVNASTVGAVQL